MVHHYYLVLLVLVLVKLRNELVSLYMGPWEIQSLANMKLFVLVRLPQVNQQKISLNPHRQLLSFNGHRSKVRNLTSGIILRFIPVVNRLCLLLLINQFP